MWLLGGRACVVAPGGACMVALGGMHGCSWGGMRDEGGRAWQRGGICGEGGACVAKGGVHGEGGHMWYAPPDPRDMAGHCVGGTHPTGMHSCFKVHVTTQRI